MTAVIPPVNRYQSLDGLRGIAALTVVVGHFFSAYVPYLIPGQLHAMWWGSDTPMAVFYNGGFAVAVFFVLSGFVVSLSASNRRIPLWLSASQRYFRLAIPMLGGTLFGWALLTLCPHTMSMLQTIEPHRWLDFTFIGRPPALSAAFWSGIAGVFIQGSSRFNNVLWTMKIELFGSLLIFAFYALPRTKWTLPVLTLAVLTALLLHSAEYSALAVGAILQELTTTRRLPSRFAYSALALAILLGFMMPGFGERIGLSHMTPIISLGEPHRVWHVVAGAAMIYAVLNLPFLRTALETRPLRFAGEISFGVYLTHVPILCTVFVPGFLWARGQPVRMTILFFCFMTSSVAVGYVFNVLVDRPVVQALHQIRRRYLHMPAKRPGLG